MHVFSHNVFFFLSKIPRTQNYLNWMKPSTAHSQKSCMDCEDFLSHWSIYWLGVDYSGNRAWNACCNMLQANEFMVDLPRAFKCQYNLADWYEYKWRRAAVLLCFAICRYLVSHIFLTECDQYATTHNYECRPAVSVLARGGSSSRHCKHFFSHGALSSHLLLPFWTSFISSTRATIVGAVPSHRHAF